MPLQLLLRIHASRSRFVPSAIVIITGRRAYATHKEQPPSSNVLSQQLDHRARDAQFASPGYVGPFQMGGVQSIGPKEDVKKWKELNTGGKVIRTTARTTNLIVILLGAGFSAMLVYALATELFAKNSPTVLYKEACEKIKASQAVTQHLRGNIKFHSTPPALGRPQHRNRRVTHHLRVDAKGREHMFINFFISCDEASANQDMNAFQRSIAWCQHTAEGLRTSSLGDVQAAAKERWRDLTDYLSHIFLLLTNQGVTPPPRLPYPTAEPVKQEIAKPQPSNAWGFAGIFGGLRGKSQASQQRASTSTGETSMQWQEAEVHADLVREADGSFAWRYLLVDIPSSRSRNPRRIFIERAADVRESEAVMLWN